MRFTFTFNICFILEKRHTRGASEWWGGCCRINGVSRFGNCTRSHGAPWCHLRFDLSESKYTSAHGFIPTIHERYKLPNWLFENGHIRPFDATTSIWPICPFFKSNLSTSVSSSSSQVENANTLTMKCSDVYLYESSLQPDQFGSLPKLQVSPKSLFLPLMMMAMMITKKMTKMVMAMKMATKMTMTTIIMARRWR